MVDAQGNPYGSIIDVIREAAERGNIKLEWIHVPKGPDHGLSKGIVDLWPIINQLPERSHFHFTQPYAEVTYWLISKNRERPLLANDVANRAVGITRGLAERIAEKYLPQARIEELPNVPALVAGICRGDLFAGLIAESITHASLFHKPEGCQLRMSPIPGARLWAGIAAAPGNREAARAADSIRSEIGSMVRDGTFSTISLKWFGYPTNEAVMVESLAAAHRETTTRSAWLGVVAVAGVLLLWMGLRLHRANRSAQHAAAAKSQFLANMSHEIRTPMNGILGMTELTLAGECSAEQREYLGMVRSSADSLLTIINDILDFSKMESGKLIVESIRFDLRVAIEDAVSLLLSRAAEKGIDLLLDYGPDLPSRFVGDPGRIKQIVLNLAGNALKFTNSGHVLIRVTCEQTSQSGVITIAVSDTGIGIPNDKQHLLFDKFTQADSSTTREFGGTGLGLAISRQLARLMGGDIGFHSEFQVGSTFSLSLPLQIDRTRPEPILPQDVDLSGIRALIVDDHHVNRAILLNMLKAWGMRPEAVADGEEGLAALCIAAGNGDPFRIALIDGQLPGINGESLGRCIREDNSLGSTELLLLTSQPVKGDRSRVEAAGFAGYFSKPIRSTLLQQAIAAILNPNRTTKTLITRFDLTAPRESAKPAARTGANGSGLRVLLAEDNLVNQKLAATLLRKAGCEVDIAGTGTEAVARWKQASYDAIFMDCQMPEMDGYEATATIRGLENGQSRTFISAMTAHAFEGDRQRCLAAGMDDYLSKPLRVDLLDRMLTELQTRRADSGAKSELATVIRL